MRLVVMRTRLSLIPLLVAALTACGSGTGDGVPRSGPVPATAASEDEHVERLLELADEAAERNGGEAKLVEAVRTTRRAAEGLSGSASNQPDVPVWVVQVSGTDYSCDGCSVPQGAEAPRGRYLTLVPTVDTYEGTSFGISPRPKDLAALGPVEVLRDER